MMVQPDGARAVLADDQVSDTRGLGRGAWIATEGCEGVGSAK